MNAVLLTVLHAVHCDLLPLYDILSSVQAAAIFLCALHVENVYNLQKEITRKIIAFVIFFSML